MPRLLRDLVIRRLQHETLSLPRPEAGVQSSSCHGEHGQEWDPVLKVPGPGGCLELPVSTLVRSQQHTMIKYDPGSVTLIPTPPSCPTFPEWRSEEMSITTLGVSIGLSRASTHGFLPDDSHGPRLRL